MSSFILSNTRLFFHFTLEPKFIISNKITSRKTGYFASIAGSWFRRNVKKAAPRPRHEFQSEMAKPPLFDGNPGKVVGFIIVYKLYIRIRMRKKLVEEQVY